MALDMENKTIKVTMEFPVQSDEKARQEFISRLKMLYLEKAQCLFSIKDGEETDLE